MAVLSPGRLKYNGPRRGNVELIFKRCHETVDGSFDGALPVSEVLNQLEAVLLTIC